MLWLYTPHLKKKKSISLSRNIPECCEPHRSTCGTSMRSLLVFQTYAVICFSSILCRNLSKKYQPKKKEEDENKYVWILIQNFKSRWITCTRCVNQHFTSQDRFMASYIDDVTSCRRYTWCRAFYSTLNELNDYAGQHEVIAENMTSQIIADLTRYAQEVKTERKSVSEGSLS